MSISEDFNSLRVKYIPLSELEIGKAYKIMSFTKLVGQYGPSIQVTLADDHGTLLKSFLPRRYNQVLSADRIANYVEGEYLS